MLSISRLSTFSSVKIYFCIQSAKTISALSSLEAIFLLI